MKSLKKLASLLFALMLGASLAGLGDERIGMELDALFEEEDLWQ
jgi:uncharacterized lipoprotein YehR (DUF1307 family)